MTYVGIEGGALSLEGRQLRPDRGWDLEEGPWGPHRVGVEERRRRAGTWPHLVRPRRSLTEVLVHAGQRPGTGEGETEKERLVETEIETEKQR